MEDFNKQYKEMLDRIYKTIRRENEKAAYNGGYKCQDCGVVFADDNAHMTHYCNSVRTFHADNHHMRRR